MRDLVVIGGGPSGLAAAVYGASEGLDVLLLETSSPCGQAGSSSRIENYLGFPTGISGQELAARAYHQAQKFGAEMLISKATQLICNHRPYGIEVESGIRISARTVVIATGAQYRKLPLQNLSRFEGAGVYYGATFVEAQLCGREEEVIVIGGKRRDQACIRDDWCQSKYQLAGWLRSARQQRFHKDWFGSVRRKSERFTLAPRPPTSFT